MMLVFGQEHDDVPRANSPYGVGSDRSEQTGANEYSNGVQFWYTYNIPHPVHSLKEVYFPTPCGNWLDSRVASGPTPPELGELSALEGVDLSSNRLNGKKKNGLPR